jgi:hypothetical protein
MEVQNPLFAGIKGFSDFTLYQRQERFAMFHQINQRVSVLRTTANFDGRPIWIIGVA